MGERRSLTRQRSFLRGRVFFINRQDSENCLIRDISLRGTRIMSSDLVTTPGLIDLHIPRRSQAIRARVEWRRGNELGLNFPEAATSPPESVNLVQRIAQLEIERASLQRMVQRLKSKRLHAGSAEPVSPPRAFCGIVEV